MKKIRLNVANLEATEILSREQLKSIFGGKSYTCIRTKDNVSETVRFSDASAEAITAWEDAWQSLGWSAWCSAMPVSPGGSGSGSGSYFV